MKKIISKLTLLAITMSLLVPSFANAAALTSMSVTPSSNTVSAATNYVFQFTATSGVSAAGTMTVVLPSGFSWGSVDYTDIDVEDDDSDLTLDSTPSGATWGAAISSQTLTITSGTGTIAAGSVIEIEVGTNATAGTTGDQQITNSSSAGSHQFDFTSETGTDTGSAAATLVTDPDVEITAEVEPSITLAVSAGSLDLGTLSASSHATGTFTGTVSTNALNGYVVSYTSDGLTNSNSDTIEPLSSAAASNGTEGWGINVKNNATPDIGAEPTGSGGEGTPSVAAAYATADQFTIVTDGSRNTLISADGTADAHVVTVSVVANISGITEAGDYTGTLSVLAIGNF